MIDKATITQIAQRFSLPPPLVSALDQQSAPEQLLTNYGLAPEDKGSAAALTVVAHAVAQQFSLTKDIQSALSHVYAGDPHAAQSDTSPAGGMVDGILGAAAVNLAHGWENYSPTDAKMFDAVASSMKPFLQETKDMGGIVGEDALKFWDSTVAKIAAPAKTTSTAPAATAHPTAPKPTGPEPGAVESFAGQMKGLGIDVDHFMQHFQSYSALRYQLLKSKTDLQAYSEVSGMHPAQMLEHVRSQPHPTYNHLTTGQYADAHDLATIHALPATNQPPQPSLVAKFAGSGAGWKEISDFYARHGNAAR